MNVFPNLINYFLGLAIYNIRMNANLFEIHKDHGSNIIIQLAIIDSLAAVTLLPLQWQNNELFPNCRVGLFVY